MRLSKCMKIFVLFLLICSRLNGQDLIPDYSEPSIVYISNIDSFEYKQLNPSRSKKRLFVNQIAIDSTRLAFSDLIIVKGLKGLIGVRELSGQSKLNFFSINQRTIKKEVETDLYDVLSDRWVVQENILIKKNKKLYKINPNTWQISELTNIAKHSNDHDFQEIMPSSDGKKILIQYGEDVGGGRDIYGILEYDFETSVVKDRTEDFRKVLPTDNITAMPIEFILKRQDENHLYIETLDGDPNIIKDDWVLDNGFRIVGKCLSKRTYAEGLNIEKGKIISYNVSSETDRGNVIIKYHSSYELEREFYKIYNDTLLTLTEVKFKKSQLELLKNFVFAKHNYKFESDYYQAYFNLFEFYNSEEKRKTRVKDVNPLLTNNDKQNLALITGALKRAK